MSGGQGTFTIDFGAGATDKTVNVSMPAITTGQVVEAWVLPAQTASNEIDNHWIERINVIAYSVVNATGFTATATADEGFLHGVFNFGFAYN